MSSTTTSTSVADHQRGAVGPEQLARDGGRAGPVGVGHGDADQFEADSGAGGDVVLAGQKELGQRAADVPAAQERRPSPRRWHADQRPGKSLDNATGCPHGQRVFPPHESSRVRSSSVSRRTTTRAVPSATKTTAGRGTLL